MINYVGVTPWIENMTNRIKSYSLLFDKIAITNISSSLNPSFKRYINYCDSQPELKWLIEQNILFETNWWDSFKLASSNEGLVNAIELKKLQTIQGDMILHYDDSVDTGEHLNSQLLFEEMLTRFLSIYFCFYKDYQAFPLISIPSKINSLDNHIALNDVIDLTITQFPVPDELTPWENIIEFKKENRDKLLLLRRWIHEVTRKEMSLKDIYLELEYLKSEYEKAMRIYEIKYTQGVVETVITATLEMIENVARLQPSKVAKSLFNIKRRKVDLLEAELKAPGREISYVVKAQEAFRQ